MPGLNFNYTKFLREQHEKYIKKYGDDPIKAEPNPQPIIGFSGHVPTYRGSIHEQRVVRSLVRCISSPMKPTTATGYRSKSRQFYNPDDENSPRCVTTRSSGRTDSENPNTKAVGSDQVPERVMSAPAVITREKTQEKPNPADIAMMAAGSSALLKQQRAKTGRHPTNAISPRILTSRSSTRSSTSSLAPIKVHEPLPASKHPSGYPQTLYGSSYWYAWPGNTPRQKSSRGAMRPDSYNIDRRLDRKDGVLYHKHEGIVPKYLGYVPGYKFRHGSTFGVLTVNATSDGLTHRLLAKS